MTFYSTRNATKGMVTTLMASVAAVMPAAYSPSLPYCLDIMGTTVMVGRAMIRMRQAIISWGSPVSRRTLPHETGKRIIFAAMPTYSSGRLSTVSHWEKHSSAPRYIMHMADVAFLMVASVSHTTWGSGISKTTNTRASSMATMLGVSRFLALNAAFERSEDGVAAAAGGGA